MSNIHQTMSADHRACDKHFAAAEQAAASNDLEGAKQHLAQFVTDTERHLRAEEELLFPEFEKRTGMTMGPTRVMRHEHAQMRELFRAMESALAASDLDEFLGQAETLMILMQQHNMKEENVLYPMTDQAFGPEGEALATKLRELR